MRRIADTPPPAGEGANPDESIVTFFAQIKSLADATPPPPSPELLALFAREDQQPIAAQPRSKKPHLGKGLLGIILVAALGSGAVGAALANESARNAAHSVLSAFLGSGTPTQGPLHPTPSATALQAPSAQSPAPVILTDQTKQVAPVQHPEQTKPAVAPKKPESTEPSESPEDPASGSGSGSGNGSGGDSGSGSGSDSGSGSGKNPEAPADDPLVGEQNHDGEGQTKQEGESTSGTQRSVSGSSSGKDESSGHD